MKTFKEIMDALQGKKKSLFERYPIESLAVFGSFSREEQTELSDIDLLVEFNSKIGSQFIDLADELESFLGVKVDLVSRKGIKDKYFNIIKNELKYV
ncbi:nucleotidyltransferase family protein [Aquiflexum gelatinilyticum]|uniref:Nucleotidyltransferase family protein n=1 Tax=Aquiflexum gelatinilyticum TaxID=2961943 RepID=A0A9X2P3E9_9BACT|nr:nucleotidyltransferase family protein [Aquiflexum gelatinilyticum]MCR9013891.1 nucleotidyltransferase family protein [Aquiflexum gelatinilyticum]MCS4433410.1 nucleotidyltransferase family protein [Aquiflexum gelatinilyticum]